ncbi:MAG: hypothetical protein ABIB11_05140, partial [Candidatus Omnitrophota bacterium]
MNTLKKLLHITLIFSIAATQIAPSAPFCVSAQDCLRPAAVECRRGNNEAFPDLYVMSKASSAGSLVLCGDGTNIQKSSEQLYAA